MVCWEKQADMLEDILAASKDTKGTFIEQGKSDIPLLETEAKLEQFECKIYDQDTSKLDVSELRWNSTQQKKHSIRQYYEHITKQ